jgi:hypothetical protein
MSVRRADVCEIGAAFRMQVRDAFSLGSFARERAAIKESGDAVRACALRTRGRRVDRDRARWRRRCAVGGAGGDLGLSGLVVRRGAVFAAVSLAPPSDDRLCGLIAAERRTGACGGRSAASESGGDGLRASAPWINAWTSWSRGRTNGSERPGVGCLLRVADDVSHGESGRIVHREPVGLRRVCRFRTAAQRFCAGVLRRTLHSGRVQRSRADARQARPAPCRSAVQTFGADLRCRPSVQTFGTDAR